MIDTCGFTSGQVQATSKLLADSVNHYTFISSISVYRDFTKSGLDENGALEQLPDGVVEDMGDPETYGARKALAEQVAEDAMPNRVLTGDVGHDPLAPMIQAAAFSIGCVGLLATENYLLRGSLMHQCNWLMSEIWRIGLSRWWSHGGLAHTTPQDQLWL
ncbi:MAG: hypothetical protein QM813_06855 [Verrucomicrobiota bacterium]